MGPAPEDDDEADYDSPDLAADGDAEAHPPLRSAPAPTVGPSRV